eukprot:gene1687-1880_t
MKSSRGFSILCDKATFCTFCVNVRYVNDKCEPTTKLYRLLLVGKEGGADALFELLATIFAEDGIEWNDVIGYASDGENLMQGRNNSLLTQMKAAVPDLYILKCYCHSFNLVAGHACETLSNTAEQLTHDIYNYFKDSPNRKKIFEEFQHFYDCEPHKILKSCQTRWLSLSQCVTRIISQWPALEYFFTAEIFETKSLQAEKILQHLKLNYIKATFEFIDFVLGDLKGLSILFQSNDFELHRFLPEMERVFSKQSTQRYHMREKDFRHVAATERLQQTTQEYLLHGQNGKAPSPRFIGGISTPSTFCTLGTIAFPLAICSRSAMN